MPDRAMLVAEQAARGHSFIGTLDMDHLWSAQERDAVDQACGRSAEHDPTRRSHRFHPLCHAYLLADGGVTKCSRTDFAGDYLARVQTDPQLALDAVALGDVVGEPLDLVLDFQGGKAAADRVVLQCCRRAEDGHDAVTGEAADRTAVTRHHC